MDVKEAINKRRAYRSFDPIKISHEIIQKILIKINIFINFQPAI